MHISKKTKGLPKLPWFTTTCILWLFMYILGFSGKYWVNDHITSAPLRNPGRPRVNLCASHSHSGLISYFVSSLLFSLETKSKFHLCKGILGVVQCCVHSWGREKVLIYLLKTFSFWCFIPCNVFLKIQCDKPLPHLWNTSTHVSVEVMLCALPADPFLFLFPSYDSVIGRKEGKMSTKITLGSCNNAWSFSSFVCN